MAAQSTAVLAPQTTESTDSQSGGHYSVSRVGSVVISDAKPSQASPLSLELWSASFGNPWLEEVSLCPLLCLCHKLSPDCLSSGSPCVSLPPSLYEVLLWASFYPDNHLLNFKPLKSLTAEYHYKNWNPTPLSFPTSCSPSQPLGLPDLLCICC